MMNPRAAELYRDYLNESDPTAKEMLRQQYFEAVKERTPIEAPEDEAA